MLLFLTYRSPCGPPYQRPNVVETKYIVKKNGPMGTSNQANAAASFFAKAHQKLQLNNNGLHDLRNVGGGCSPAASRRPLLQNNNATGITAEGGGGQDSSENEREQFPTNFRAIVHRSAPQIPSHLLRRLELSSGSDHVGKIKVILRVAKSSSLSAADSAGDTLGNQIFLMDRKRKQLTMYDPSVFRNSSAMQHHSGMPAGRSACSRLRFGYIALGCFGASTTSWCIASRRCASTSRY